MSEQESAISNYLSAIESAVYGKDVRSAIVNAISECYSNVQDGVTEAHQAISEIDVNGEIKTLSELTAEMIYDIGLAEDALEGLETFAVADMDEALGYLRMVDES